MRLRSPVRLLFVALLCMAGLPGVSHDRANAQDSSGQGYQSISYDTERYKDRSLVTSVLQGREKLDGKYRPDRPFGNETNQKRLENYLRYCVFAEMTQPDRINDFPDMRSSFVNFMRSAREAEPRKILVQYSVGILQSIYKNTKYHPAVRYNAVLVLGEIDETQASGFGADRTETVPSQAALTLLLEIIQATDPTTTDALKVAALRGLKRHAETFIPIPRREDIIAAMTGIVTEKNAPAGRSPDAHHWIRQRAIEILGALGQPGANDIGIKSIIQVLSDKSEPIAVQCAAAAALGNMSLVKQQSLDKMQTAKLLLQAAWRACQQERDPKQRGRVLPSRARLAVNLEGVHQGLAGLRGVATGNAQGEITKMYAAVGKILRTLQDPGTSDSSLTTQLPDFLSEITAFIGVPAAAPTSTTPTPMPAATPPTDDPTSEFDGF